MKIEKMTGAASATCLLAIVLRSASANAQDPPPPAVPAKLDDPSNVPPKVTPTGYVEALYSYNFNNPSNGITNYRGFDNRHNSFQISNVAAGMTFEAGPVSGKILLHVGNTPSTYYLAEPTLAGTPGANASGPELWKYIQEAYVGYKAPVGSGLLLQMGVFLSPIGPETMPVKDNWNWSRSNLFFGLPFYHTGLRASYDVSGTVKATLHVYNGINSVIDQNQEKSVAASVSYTLPDKFNAQALYYGGIERNTGSLEGPYWRHLFDLYAQWDVNKRFSVLAHGDAGLEPNRFGTSSWVAGALYLRFKATGWLYVAARGDRFWETVASNASGTATPLYWPLFAGSQDKTKWVSSGTVTLDVRPRDNISFRLEYRHDQADGNLYFFSSVPTDPVTGQLVPNSKSQDTAMLGATAWF